MLSRIEIVDAEEMTAGATNKSAKRIGTVVAGVAASLLLMAAVVHHYHSSSSLLQNVDEQRRISALKELGANSLLFLAERQAYINGFKAGEIAGEEDVVEDERQQERMAAVLGKWEAEAKERLEAEKFRSDRMNKVAGINLPKADKEDVKSAAKARLAAKSSVLAQPGSMMALKLMEFCAKEFAGNEMLQRFCYDRLNSKEKSKDAAALSQVIDSPTIEGAMEKAESEGLQGPPKYADLHGELFDVIPLKSAARSVAQSKKKGEVEVKAQTLQQSIDEAHDLGFKGDPQAIIYHPAHGKPDVYMKAKPYVKPPPLSGTTQELASAQQGKIEVDSSTLAGSINAAHKMGLKGQPEAIVYHPAQGKPELYVLQDKSSARKAAAQKNIEKKMQGEQKSELSQRPIEVDGRTLSSSMALARSLGLKGRPEGIIYHPASGKPVLYFPGSSNQSPQGATELAAAPVRKVGAHEVEVDGKTLQQSLAEARAMGFRGDPEAIVYHPAHGKTAIYQRANSMAAVDVPVRMRHN
ncbi:hypothetical protein GUITHDRAFT_154096 [Guillardia theta CCMP2712]|uniref:Uncharacterized protein n=3 Tax=Guillardia theta TaxID=55529 RepID=L1IWB9_GUITC|nr:hypothetical protein GUITHDRAFT_154096 [Guillardia theta CCMP2712]EKX40563.1 hypothetical protein GUITHDRAFT_154096 [Guillardia theta CCMP2712]|eukprot:XP_005827543.1 hypothetical protein GUITHDRAFT_154096 [Guillardia theta CCMP2712]